MKGSRDKSKKRSVSCKKWRVQFTVSVAKARPYTDRWARMKRSKFNSIPTSSEAKIKLTSYRATICRDISQNLGRARPRYLCMTKVFWLLITSTSNLVRLSSRWRIKLRIIKETCHLTQISYNPKASWTHEIFSSIILRTQFTLGSNSIRRKPSNLKKLKTLQWHPKIQATVSFAKNSLATTNPMSRPFPSFLLKQALIKASIVSYRKQKKFKTEKKENHSTVSKGKTKCRTKQKICKVWARKLKISLTSSNKRSLHSDHRCCTLQTGLSWIPLLSITPLSNIPRIRKSSWFCHNENRW